MARYEHGQPRAEKRSSSSLLGKFQLDEPILVGIDQCWVNLQHLIPEKSLAKPAEEEYR